MVKSGNREEGLLVIDRIIEAFHFAVSDPYRAATHNKGIMNAIFQSELLVDKTGEQ